MKSAGYMYVQGLASRKLSSRKVSQDDGLSLKVPWKKKLSAAAIKAAPVADIKATSEAMAAEQPAKAVYFE